MREIKFKYWNGVTNIYVDEPLMPFKDGWTITQLFSERGWIWLQYTGLKDKKGIEIYIGDIIIDNNVFIETVDVGVGQVPVAELPDGRIWEVTMRDFEDGIVLLNNEKEMGCCDYVEGEFSITECEVIGNIYQNPELLT